MSRPDAVARFVLVGAGVALQASLVGLCALRDPRQEVAGFLVAWTCAFAAFGAAVWAVRRVSPRFAVGCTLLFAVAFRLTMLGLPATLSDDYYRYFWDGRLTVLGHDPYAAPPEDASLVGLREDALYPHLNSRPYHTVYPPVSQAAFASAWWLGGGDLDRAVAALRWIFIVVDFGAVLAMLGLLRAMGVAQHRALLYAWQPLVVIELIGAMHSEALLALPLVLMLWAVVRGRCALAGAALAGAVWVKLFPVVLVGAMAGVCWRRGRFPISGCGSDGAGGDPALRCAQGSAWGGGWRGVLMLGVGFGVVFLLLGWPMLRPTVVGNVRTSLELYAGYFSFNSALFEGLRWVWGWVLDSDAYRGVSRALPWVFAAWALGVWVWVAAGRWWRDGAVGHCAAVAALLLLGGYLVCSPTVHPWYLGWVLWLVPVLPGRTRAWLWLSFWAGWSYLAYHRDPVWVPVWVLGAEWGGFALLALLDARGLWSPGVMRLRAQWKARRLAAHVAGTTLLDVGCGEGYVAAALAPRAQARATLVDVHDRSRVALPMVRYDGRTLPFGDGAFDTVMALTVLHHCDDPERVLDECVRVAQRRLVIAESVYRTRTGLRVLTVLDRFFNGLRTGGDAGGFAGPLHFATAQQWERRFAERGLRLAETIWLSKGFHRHVVFVLDKPQAGGAGG